MSIGAVSRMFRALVPSKGRHAAKPRHTRAAVIAAIAVVVAGVSAPLVAHALDDVTLTVHVTSKAGTPLAGLNVWVKQVDASGLPLVGPASFNGGAGDVAADEQSTAGDYVLSFSSGHQYELVFETGNQTSFDQIYPGVSIADPAHGSVLSYGPGQYSLSASLQTYSTISGKVTDAKTKKPVAHASVTAYRFDGSAWVAVQVLPTDSKGAYKLTDLDPASYRIGVDGADGSSYTSAFAGGPTLDTATSYWVGLGKTVTVNSTLGTGGVLTGTLRYTDDNDPTPATGIAAGVDVVVAPVVGDAPAHPDWSVRYTATSDATGKYTVKGLPDGLYVARAVDTRTTPQPFAFATGSITGAGWSVVADGENFVTAFQVSGGTTVTASTLTLHPVAHGQHVGVQIFEPGCDPVGDPGDCIPQSGATVTAIPLLGGRSSYGPVTTGADGFATFPDLWSDEYIVQASAPGTALVAQEGSTSAQVPDILYPGTNVLAQIVLTPPTDPLDVLFDYSCQRVVDASGDCSMTPGDVGDQLDVSPTHIDAPSAVVANPGDYHLGYTYQWYRVNGGTPQPIFGAGSAQYTVQSVDLGATLRVIVTATADGLAPVKLTHDFPVAQGPQPQFAVDPHVVPNGVNLPSEPGDFSAVAGTTLTAAYVATATDGVTPTFDWYDAVTSAPVHTGRTYTVTNADADQGRQIAVRVTLTAPAYAGPPASDASVNVATAAVHPGLALKKAPTITAKKTGASTKYTVSAGSWTPSGTTVTYSWRSTGSPTPVSTASSYTLADASDGLWVQVTASKPGYGSTSTLVHAHASTATLGDAAVPTSAAADIRITPAGGTEGPGDGVSPNVGDTVRAVPAVYVAGDDTGTFSAPTYQWQRSIDSGGTWTPIAGATHATYPVAPADASAWLRAVVTQRSQGYAPTSYATPATSGAGVSQYLATSPEPIPLPAPGTGVAGSAIAFQLIGSFPLTGTTVSYAWDRCTGTTADCSDGTWQSWAVTATPSLTTEATDQGHAFRLGSYTVSKAGYAAYQLPAPAEWVGPQGAVLLDPDGVSGPVFTRAPKITASSPFSYGEKLTVAAGTTAAKSTSAYQWYECVDNGADVLCPADADYGTDVNGHWVPIAGARSTSFTATSPLYPGPGSTLNLKLVQTATASSLQTAMASPIARITEQGTVTNTHAPTITTVKSGSTVTGWKASPGTWSQPTANCSVYYNWESSTGLAHSPTDPAQLLVSDLTAFSSTTVVTVNVVIECNGFAQATKSVTAHAGTFDTSGATTSQGATPKVDVPLDAPEASPQFGNPGPGVAYSYQWYRGSTKLTKNGGTTAEYTPQPSDARGKLKVVITAKDPRYATKSVTTTWTTAVATGDLPGLSASCDCNTPQVADVLAVAVPTTPSGLSWTVVWQTSASPSGPWTTVQSGSKRTYTVPASQFDRYLQAIVTAKKTGYTPWTTTIASLSPIGYTGEIYAVSPPLLGDSAHVGVSVAIATPASWTVSGVSLTYQWLRDGVPIPGATAATFTPEADFVGAALAVAVTAHRTGYLQGSVVSSNTLTVGTGGAPAILSGSKNAPTVTLVAGSPDGVVASASTGVWSLGGLTFHYQWFVATASNPTSFTPLGGGSDASQITATQVHDALGVWGAAIAYVAVTATAQGHASSVPATSARSAAFTTAP